MYDAFLRENFTPKEAISSHFPAHVKIAPFPFKHRSFRGALNPLHLEYSTFNFQGNWRQHNYNRSWVLRIRSSWIQECLCLVLALKPLCRRRNDRRLLQRVGSLLLLSCYSVSLLPQRRLFLLAQTAPSRSSARSGHRTTGLAPRTSDSPSSFSFGLICFLFCVFASAAHDANHT